MSLLKGSWLLKLAALGCAIGTYFFIHSQILQLEAEKKVQDPSYKLIKLTAKNLTVNARLTSVPPEGYHLLADQVSVEPSRVLVIGPEALLEQADTAETALLDVSEHTKTVIRSIPLESVAGIHLTGEPYIVKVTIPIEKIETKEQA